MTQPLEVATLLVEDARSFRKPLLTSWMGAAQTMDGRARFAQAGIPSFSTPEAAVELIPTSPPITAISVCSRKFRHPYRIVMLRM